MCIFTQQVEEVSSTNIFARLAGKEQLIAYETHIAARGTLAMVLPIPVVPGSGEDAVRFIDLSGYARLFADLAAPFETGISGSLDLALAPAPAPRTLVVHDVGSFEASFVPTPQDFARLDPRFQLPASIWERLPGYQDHGFVVAKLRSERADPGWLERVGLKRPAPIEPLHIHPLGFAFPTRLGAQLFFPTVHVHDGQVHDTATFDHALYCQSGAPPKVPTGGFLTSPEPVVQHVAVARTGGLVDAMLPCHRMRIVGPFANRDIVADLGAGGTDVAA